VVRLWLRERERRPTPEPAHTNDRTPIVIGSIAWAIALVAFLIFRSALGAVGAGWWLWIAVVGLALGIVGIVYVSIKRH
jgi:hypothetical protein